MMFMKGNEKREKEYRKKIEKEAMDKAKKEEEVREAKRTARKLNFLITQTELYSHFIGDKIKSTSSPSLPTCDRISLTRRFLTLSQRVKQKILPILLDPPHRKLLLLNKATLSELPLLLKMLPKVLNSKLSTSISVSLSTSSL